MVQTQGRFPQKALDDGLKTQGFFNKRRKGQRWRLKVWTLKAFYFFFMSLGHINLTGHCFSSVFIWIWIQQLLRHTAQLPGRPEGNSTSLSSFRWGHQGRGPGPGQLCGASEADASFGREQTDNTQSAPGRPVHHHDGPHWQFSWQLLVSLTWWFSSPPTDLFNLCKQLLHLRFFLLRSAVNEWRWCSLLSQKALVC